jgi:hypothetical protein
VGGYLLEYLSWRFLFFLGIPFALAAAILGWLILPRQQEVRSPTADYLGIFLLASFLVPLLLGISFGRDSETATSTLVLLGLTGLIGGGSLSAANCVRPFPPSRSACFGSPSSACYAAPDFSTTWGSLERSLWCPFFSSK